MGAYRNNNAYLLFDIFQASSGFDSRILHLNQKAFCGSSRGVKASPILYIFETCLINEKGAVHPTSVAMFLGLQGSEALSFYFKYQDYGKERN